MHYSRLFIPLFLLLLITIPMEGWGSSEIGERLAESLRNFDHSLVPTGILHNRVLSFVNIDDYDGSSGAEKATRPAWEQIYFEMTRSSLEALPWPEFRELLDDVDQTSSNGEIPIALLDVRCNRIREESLEEGALEFRQGRLVPLESNVVEEKSVFSVAPLRERTYRGGEVLFRLDADHYFSNRLDRPITLQIDFDDGLGFRDLLFGESLVVHYFLPGVKSVRLLATYPGGEVREGSFLFDVESLVSPDPNDTLSITATIPFEGGYGTGEAFVYLSDTHTSITNPVVVIEGFDLDNTMNWDELYALLNQENLIEEIRSRGYDAVVLNFTDATDYIQKNAFVAVQLIEELKGVVGPGVDFAMVGASMGGLVEQYALSYMENQGMDHKVRTAIFFDSPHQGANIPLGIQYWTDFFSGQSAEAALLLSRLDTPAARQMLVYHLTTPPGSTGAADSLRGALLADFASVGDYPVEPRLVAVANGSGAGLDQGFSAGNQIIDYEYNSFLVDIKGHVWAVPDGGSAMILDGLIDIILLPAETMQVTVSGTAPFDNAPGGSRSSMEDMDSTAAPYGDIIALYNNHCFIPTISALALNTSDLFYDIAGEANLMALTPFDTLYFPMENQEHVSITAESAVWMIEEIDAQATSVASAPDLPPARPMLLQTSPNPFNPFTEIRITLSREGHLTVGVHDLTGRLVRLLADGRQDPGRVELTWNGTDLQGHKVASGTYLLRAELDGMSVGRKITMVR